MRYLGSFFIALFLYSSLLFSVFFAASIQTISNPKTEKTHVVKVSLVEAKKIEEVESLKNKKIKKIKEEPKKRVEKKKIIKSQNNIPKNSIKEEPCVDNETMKKPKESLQSKPQVANNNSIKNSIDLVKKEFFLKLKKDIDKNKTYPITAKKRGIQGVVKISFKILEDGSLNNLKVIEGKNIFKKAVFDALQRSFPRVITKEINFLPVSVNLELNFKLNK